jgi:hypothetical protein
MKNGGGPPVIGLPVLEEVEVDSLPVVVEF